MDVDNFLLEVNGSGIKEALRLVLDVEFKKPSILLVEEPEVHLHPGLEVNMMRYLRTKSDACQVFLSTHSTNFIDSLESKSVYFVSKHGFKTNVDLLSVDQIEDVVPKELGLRLSSLFMFDRLVFVEGQTDEAVLREFAGILDVNLSQANVGFIPLGGIRNFAHYATEAVFNFLSKRQVELWFLLDRDERQEAEIRIVTDRFGARAKVNFLTKRELENYLVSVRPLAEFVMWKQSQGGRAVGVEHDALRRSLDQAAEKLKGLAVAKRIAKEIALPIYPRLEWQEVETEESATEKLTSVFASMHDSIETLQSALPTTLETCKANLERTWSRSKLDLVPGDILLDLVCRDFGVRFRKEVDSVRVAARFLAGEVDVELARFIREIAKPR